MTAPPDDAVAPAIRRDIAARLAAVEADHGVRRLLAVESGSRAWGFPSPDSDYDVRFVYVRPRDWYLRLRPGRDVVETPIADDIDLNGWDIRKALDLLLRANAVVGEWIDSPIRYRPDDPAVAGPRALADDALDPRALAHHYAGVGARAARPWLDDGGAVPVKRYFYTLRPALAIRALRTSPGARPPMDLTALVAAADVPGDVARDIAALVAAKRRIGERASGARTPRLDALIRAELARAGDVPARTVPPDLPARADALFRDLVNR